MAIDTGKAYIVIESLFWAYALHITVLLHYIQVLDNAGKNKSYEKTNSEFVEFVSIPQKLHPFKNPHRLPTEPMGIHHSPHTHTIPIPMGIPVPTAALVAGRLKTQNLSNA